MNATSIMSLIKKDEVGEQAGLHEVITLVYGDKKVGKSTFASQFPAPLFLDCEDGLRTVQGGDGKRPDHIPISSWLDILNVTTELEKDLQGYQTIVVDGLNEAWSYLTKYMLDRYKVEHTNDGQLAYGKGKGMMQREFRYWFQRLRKLECGIVLTAHDKVLPFEHNGVAYDKRVPYVDDSKMAEAWDTIKPAINLIIYAAKANDPESGTVKHFMRTKGNQTIEAADPWGTLPEVMEFKYDELVAALN